jgi:hypothetical protein
MVFVHKGLLPLVTEVHSTAVATGVANTLGNKGGVGVRFKLGNTTFLFVNAHLAAHQNAVKERNVQFRKIEEVMCQALRGKKTASIGGASGTQSRDEYAAATRLAPNIEPSSITADASLSRGREQDGDGDAPGGGGDGGHSLSAAIDALNGGSETAAVDVGQSSNVHAPSRSIETGSNVSAVTSAATPSSGSGGAGLKYSDIADRVCFMGDLNYRIRGTR